MMVMLFGLLIISSQKQEVIYDTLQQAKSTGLILQSTLTNMIRSGDRKALTKFLSEMQIDQSLNKGFIVDNTGTIKHSFNTSHH